MATARRLGGQLDRRADRGDGVKPVMCKDLELHFPSRNLCRIDGDRGAALPHGERVPRAPLVVRPANPHLDVALGRPVDLPAQLEFALPSKRRHHSADRRRPLGAASLPHDLVALEDAQAGAWGHVVQHGLAQHRLLWVVAVAAAAPAPLSGIGEHGFLRQDTSGMVQQLRDVARIPAPPLRKRVSSRATLVTVRPPSTSITPSI